MCGQPKYSFVLTTKKKLSKHAALLDYQQLDYQGKNAAYPNCSEKKRGKKNKEGEKIGEERRNERGGGDREEEMIEGEKNIVQTWIRTRISCIVDQCLNHWAMAFVSFSFVWKL